MTPKIIAGGYLTSLAEKVMAGGLAEKSDKLSSGELTRIATILGHLAKEHDLYSLLFNEPNQLITVDNTEVNTKDLMWFIIMEHSYARGWYWRPDNNMTSDTGLCAGVPLAFLGAKRVFNKPYSSWINKDMDVSELKKVDMFLPQGLNTWKINEEGNITLEESNASRGGAIGLIKLYKSDIDFTIEHVHRIRELISLGSSKPRKIKPQEISEDEKIGEIYNNLSFIMRCMVAQSWCWSEPSRNSDMITSYKDWDILEKSVKSKSLAMQGLSPKNTRIAPGFLAFTNTKEGDLLEFEDMEDLKI